MPEPLKLEDLYKIPSVSDPRISPDATLVAFVLTKADEEKDENQSSIWTVRANGTKNPRQLTFGTKDGAPRWSPDGDWLAFTAARGEGKAQIYLLPTQGGEARQLTKAELGAGDAVWSPDSKKIAFTSPVALEKREPHDPVVVTRLGYKADGVGLIRNLRRHLFVTDLQGDATQITSGDYSVGGPAWSPDGSKLAFVSALDENRDLEMSSSVYAIDVAGGEPKRLTPVGSPAGSVTWDGDSIVYTGGKRVEVAISRLYRLKPGGQPEPIAHELDRNIMVGGPGYPGAAPIVDGNGVVFCARDRGCTHVYESTKTTKIIGEPDQVISGLSKSDTGIFAYVCSSPAVGGEVFVAERDGTNQRKLTSFFEEALSDLVLQTPEERTFTAPDSTPIHGWILRDPKASTPGPVLLDVHGGPHNAWSPVFDGCHLYHQILASLGWTILFVNPRGSDGYGNDFFKAVSGNWGLSDEDDFLCALDALTEEGIADRDRIAVTGYSYGGYMTNWLTARTTRFAAAVTGGCVTNKISQFGTSDAGRYLGLLEAGGDPVQDPERFTKMSPVTYAQKMTTPTLILHGESDDRCPVGQAEEWFALLRGQKTEVEMVRYPGASHLFILAGRPSHRVDYNKRVVEWVTSHVTKD